MVGFWLAIVGMHMNGRAEGNKAAPCGLAVNRGGRRASQVLSTLCRCRSRGLPPPGNSRSNYQVSFFLKVNYRVSFIEYNFWSCQVCSAARLTRRGTAQCQRTYYVVPSGTATKDSALHVDNALWRPEPFIIFFSFIFMYSCTYEVS